MIVYIDGMGKSNKKKGELRTRKEWDEKDKQLRERDKVIGLMFEEGGLMKSGLTKMRSGAKSVNILLNEADELQDLIESLIDEYQISHKYLTRSEFAFALRSLIFNKSYQYIADNINQRRLSNGLKPLEKTTKHLYKIRQHYGWFINAIKRYLYGRTADVFEHTNPLYVVSELNYAARLLWNLSVTEGLERGIIDKDILGAYKMYLRTIQQLRWIIGEGVKQLRDTQEDDEKERELYKQLLDVKRRYKKQGKELDDEEALEILMQEKYKEQLGDVDTSDSESA